MNKVLLALLMFLTLNSAALAEPFKLGASQSDSSYEQSNKGVIGIRFEKLHSRYSRKSIGTRPRIVEVYPGTPAERSGLKAGDEIAKINGIATEPFNSNQIFSLMAGPPGAPLYLEIISSGPYGGQLKKNVTVMRMDMNRIESDNIFRIYKYGY